MSNNAGLYDENSIDTLMLPQEIANILYDDPIVSVLLEDMPDISMPSIWLPMLPEPTTPEPTPPELTPPEPTPPELISLEPTSPEPTPLEPTPPEPTPPKLTPLESTPSETMLEPHPEPSEDLQPHPPVEIIQQPTRRVRFRYNSEMRNRGGIRGVDSTVDNETYPTIRINYGDRLASIVVVSCVTKNIPYRVHPHGLFGPGVRDGLLVDKITISNEFELVKIGIHRVTYSQVRQELRRRAQARVPELSTYNSDLQIDPFGYGFDHTASIKREDLRAVRLAFQVFVQDRQGKWETLAPTVSEPIFEENAPSDSLEIKWVSDTWGSYRGDQTIAIDLYEKVNRKNMEVVFYEQDGTGERIWERTANIIRVTNSTIVCKSPPYDRTSDVSVDAFVGVRRRVRGSRYEYGIPRPYQYIPEATTPLAEIPVLQVRRTRMRRQQPTSIATVKRLSAKPATYKWNYSRDAVCFVPRRSSSQPDADHRKDEFFSEYESDHSDEDKSDHSSEDKSDHSGEDKSDHTGEDKSDHSGEDKSDHSGEYKSDHSGEDKSDHSSDDESDDLEELYEAIAKLFIEFDDS